MTGPATPLSSQGTITNASPIGPINLACLIFVARELPGRSAKPRSQSASQIRREGEGRLQYLGAGLYKIAARGPADRKGGLT